MTKKGFFRKVNENGEIKTFKDVMFESTGVDHPFEKNHKIWRRIKKDGTPSNVFAIQFKPDLPWAFGDWFIMIDGGWVIREFPQLKIETEISKTMTDQEYIDLLSSKYFC